MTKIVIDKDIPFLKGLFEPYAETCYVAGSGITPDTVRDAQGLIVRTRTRCGRELLENSDVRMVATATIGTDHIDTAWCRSRGIEVRNAAGCNARGVLHWVAAVLVHAMTARGMKPQQTTLGIIGVGHVGSLVREYAVRWGFRTVCCDPPREEREHCGFVSAQEVFRQADIVTLHVPLDDSTRHMVGAGLIGSRTPFIINASRGEVTDTAALLASGADFALDVWENEPHIDLRALARAEIATPHIAGYSLQGKANASAAVVQAAAGYFGFPLKEWYPEGIERTVPLPITWEELCMRMPLHYDIAAETLRLKRNPQAFEQMRNGYEYRTEFF